MLDISWGSFPIQSLIFFPIQRQKAKKNSPKTFQKKMEGEIRFSRRTGVLAIFIKITVHKKINVIYVFLIFYKYTFLSYIVPLSNKNKIKCYSLMTWKKYNISGKRRIAPPPPPGFESPVTRRRPASSSGRGRPSRRYSSEDSGIYISIYLFISKYSHI